MKALTKKELKEIQELAACFFTREEIARILQLPIDDFVQGQYEDDPISKAMEAGRLKSEAEIRKSIFDLAKSGSGPAQVIAVQIMKEFHLKKIRV